MLWMNSNEFFEGWDVLLATGHLSYDKQLQPEIPACTWLLKVDRLLYCSYVCITVTVCSKAKMNIESHRPPEQPAAAPAVAAAAAAATRAAENDYFSIKKPSELSKVTTDDDKSENIDDDDPTYESIGGATVSQMSPAVQIQSYGSCKDVCDSERGESSAA